MADLRIVDAPDLPLEEITDEVKIPTGGKGNYAVKAGDVATYVEQSKDLANKTFVNNSSNGVKQQLDAHKNDKENPHNVTKDQIGLGNVNNTADLDKPVSNATSAAIITANQGKADKTYVDTQLGLKANKTYVDTQDALKANKADLGTASSYDFEDLPTSDAQKVVNRFGGITFWDGGVYPLNGEVRLDNGDVVKSTVADNTKNPNIDMTGWTLISSVRTPSVLDNKKVKGSGVSSDSVGLQEYFRATDDDRKASIFFPLRDNNYLITSPVVLQEPTMIFGDVGATYNRGIGKTGKILIDNAAEYAFNLGNEREWSNDTQDVDKHLSKNPADQWTIKNINFGRASNVAGWTKDAIKHTTKTDGPDRGFLMREVGGVNLRHVLHATDQGKSTQIATVVIENGVMSNCVLPVKVDGRILGFRFVGNQAEQNDQGVAHGCIDGSITIEDNMLEGQKNPINIYPYAMTGGTPKISFKANYLESMSGDYILKAEATYGGRLEIANNYLLYVSSVDPILLKGGWDYINNSDNMDITFDTDYFVKSGSKISKTNNFKVYQRFSATLTNKIVSDFDILPQSSNYVTTPIVNAANVIKTKQGFYNYRGTLDSFTGVPLSVAVGDVVCLNVVYYDDLDSDVSASHQVYNSDNTVVLAENTLTHEGASGNIKVATLHFAVKTASSSINYRALGRATSYVLGASAKIIGNTTSNINARFDTEASAPKIKRIDEPFVYIETYNPASIAANATLTKTLASPFFGIRPALSQRVFAHFSMYDAGIEVSARITTDNTINVYFKNTTGAAIDLAEGVLTVQLFSAPI